MTDDALLRAAVARFTFEIEKLWGPNRPGSVTIHVGPDGKVGSVEYRTTEKPERKK